MKNFLEKIKVKIFADGAKKDDIFLMNSFSYINGFTTNPTLMRKAGISSYENFSKEILVIVQKKPLSLEVFSDDFNEMEKQARKISSWGQNVYVKIPITNSMGKSSINLIKKLSDDGVKLNITALFTEQQVQETISALNINTKSIISIFAGRIADTGKDPTILIKKTLSLIGSNKNHEVLWASTRQIFNIIEADDIGCHIITVSPDIINKFNLINYDLEKYSLDTVKQFYEDAKKSNYVIS
jgi:transaldolase